MTENDLPLAAIDDVLQGNLWAYEDDRRRPSKRHEDLADIARRVESRAEVAPSLPQLVRERIR